MKSKYIFAIFLVIAAIQIMVPTQMILKREDVLETGKLYKFRTEPIDPADPFRGKYIALNFETETFKPEDSTWQRGDAIYVYVEEDSLGFAKVCQISKEVKEDIKTDFLEAKVDWYSNYSKTLNITFPFNRFYMEESKAYSAEVAVRENQRDSVLNAVYAEVYIKKGTSVLKDVIIKNMSIKDYVQKELERN